MKKDNVDVNAVFTPGTIPSYTYNPRKSHQLEETIQEHISSGGFILVVTGVTKSGKSVLVNKMVDENIDGIFLAGGSITSVQKFWEQIVDKLRLSKSVAILSEDQTSETLEGSIEGGFKMGLVQLISSIKGTTKKGKTIGTTEITDRSLDLLAIEGMLRFNQKLVIDDFHYIDDVVQKDIVRALKDPVFRGLKVIIIAVPHKTYKVVQGERELTGRVKELVITPWSDEELREIASKGFKELNMDVPRYIIEKFASESFQSPNLMQHFCLSYCISNQVTQKHPYLKPYYLTSDEVLNKIFLNTAKENVFSDEFEQLAMGPKGHGRKRKEYLFASHGKCDLYKSILLAIPKTGCRYEITLQQLSDAINSLLVPSYPTPKQGYISSTLLQMNEIAKKNAGKGDPVIEWEKTRRKLFIIDPYFAFFLKWGEHK